MPTVHPTWLKRAVRELAYAAQRFADHGDSDIESFARSCRELVASATTKRKAAPPRVLAEPRRRERVKVKRESHREATKKIREAVFALTEGACGVAGCGRAATAMDHWRGGFGRRRQQQSVETCWPLCREHDALRTRNWPDAGWWNEARKHFCRRHGHPFVPHKEFAT